MNRILIEIDKANESLFDPKYYLVMGKIGTYVSQKQVFITLNAKIHLFKPLLYKLSYFNLLFIAPIQKQILIPFFQNLNYSKYGITSIKMFASEQMGLRYSVIMQGYGLIKFYQEFQFYQIDKSVIMMLFPIDNVIIFDQQYRNQNQVTLERCSQLLRLGKFQQEQDFQELPICTTCLQKLDIKTTGLCPMKQLFLFDNSGSQKINQQRCKACKQVFQIKKKNKQCQQSQCSLSQDIWICMICGYSGCGRYKSAHAKQHFLITGHALSIQAQHLYIWDYINDQFVHRINQPIEPDREASVWEYCYLLSSQLEQQRISLEKEFSDFVDLAVEERKKEEKQLMILEEQVSAKKKLLQQKGKVSVAKKSSNKKRIDKLNKLKNRKNQLQLICQTFQQNLSNPNSQTLQKQKLLQQLHHKQQHLQQLLNKLQQ